jgi:hypothetical protein
MTLKEKFDNVEIMFESQTGILKYDELYEASNHCVKIADEFAIEFAVWLVERVAGEKGLVLQEGVLERFKKEKGL